MTPANGENNTPADVALANARALVSRLLAVVFLAIVVVAVAGIAFRYAEVGRDGRRNAENLADVLSQYLEIRLGAIDGVLFRVVASSRRIGGPAASEREWATALRTAMSGVTGLSSIIITDADGVVAHSTLLQAVGVSWAERSIFGALRDGHANLLAVGPPLSVVAGNENLIPFGRVLTDPRGEFEGTAIATLVPGQLQDFYRAFDLGQSGVAWALLPSGAVLFRAGSAADLASAAALSALPTAAAAPSDWFVRGPLAPGGRDYLTAYRRSDIADLVVAVSLSQSDLLSRWRYEALAVLVLLCATGAFLFYARRRINAAMTGAVETALAEAPPRD
jgi:hypothetical protein